MLGWWMLWIACTGVPMFLPSTNWLVLWTSRQRQISPRLVVSAGIFWMSSLIFIPRRFQVSAGSTTLFSLLKSQAQSLLGVTSTHPSTKSTSSSVRLVSFPERNCHHCCLIVDWRLNVSSICSKRFASLSHQNIKMNCVKSQACCDSLSSIDLWFSRFSVHASVCPHLS